MATVRFCCSLALLLTLVSCRPSEKYYLTEGEIFKTTAHIKYRYSKDLGNEIYARLDSFDLSLNPFNSQSIIYKVNHNEPVAVDDWFITVFNKAQEIAALTNGAYDITCAPLISLWGFGPDSLIAPTPHSIDSIRQFVGYQKIWLDGRQVIKADPRVQLNASSIAKGYAVDLVAELFENKGIKNYMVEIGGEIHAHGHNPAGNDWQIEVSKPVDDSTGVAQERMQVISLHNRSVATSGNYRNYHIRDGKKVVHTINPLTGYPVQTDLLSVSILYPDCMTADAVATACMVTGSENAKKLIAHFPGMESLLN
ncbi:MAG: FAD:protein FMN transferase [Candidatus Symbiothrix sp.]|jgi:thiamine biosynthesis lipoprotein|nr:FAD:protein FMN transferase [Candidatus Symbiothrix sp.]